MGWMSGKYRRDAPRPEGSRTPEVGPLDPEHAYTVVETLTGLASARGATVAEMALAWVLGRPSVASVVFGARNEQQFKENRRAVDINLSEEERDALDRASRRPLPYPYWHQQQYNRERLRVSLVEP